MNKRFMGWLVALLVLAPLSVFLINKLFFASPNMNVDEAAERYIENSVEVNLKVPDDSQYNLDHINTGIRLFGNQGKLSSMWYSETIFLDYNGSGKYYTLFFLANPEMLHRMSEGKDIVATINRDDLANPDYGTPENPIPIFYFYIPHFRERKSEQYLKAELTEETYKNTVAFYLAYIMPKDEFNKMFKTE
jgi:hypothetical protein